jgi:putative transposase
MQRTYKYRLYPSKAQVRKLDATLTLCCELYNAALQERRDAWRIRRLSLNYHAQAVQLPDIKAVRPELGLVHSQVLQETLKRLDNAFAAFFRRLKQGEKPGYPRFRSRTRYDSFTYPQSGFVVEQGKLRLSKIGKVKVKLHRPLEGKVKTLTITRSATGKWYACFVAEREAAPLPATAEMTGVDLGLKAFAVLSNGEPIPNPKFFRVE